MPVAEYTSVIALMYMLMTCLLQLRPPQPAVYLFVLDVSFNAVETGRQFQH